MLTRFVNVGIAGSSTHTQRCRRLTEALSDNPLDTFRYRFSVLETERHRLFPTKLGNSAVRELLAPGYLFPEPRRSSEMRHGVI